MRERGWKDNLVVVVNNHHAEVDEPDISKGTRTKKDDEDEETDRTQLEYLRGQLDPTFTEHHFERRKRFDLDIVPSGLEE
jgi:hypothetical protein